MKKIIWGGVIIVIIGLIGFASYKACKIIQYNNLPIWEKKIQTEQNIKIGIITDTHVHPKKINRQDEDENAPRYLKEKTLRSIKKFVAQMGDFHPDFVIHLGDVIEGSNDSYAVGRQGIELVREQLSYIGAPIYWVVGNHDLRSLTKEQFKNTLELESLNQVFDKGDYRFIILDANFNMQNLSREPGKNSFIPGKIPPEEMSWLEEQLQTDKNVFIFIHQGVFTHLVEGDEAKTKQSILNAKEFQELLAKYHVQGVFNGHMEARHFEMVGKTLIHSLTGTKKSKKYPESYYELDIIKGIPHLKMFYTPKNNNDKIVEIDFKTGPEATLRKQSAEGVQEGEFEGRAENQEQKKEDENNECLTVDSQEKMREKAGWKDV